MTQPTHKPDKIFKSFTRKDLKPWLVLSGKLWPDESVGDLKALFPVLLSRRKYFFRACLVNGEWAGFVYVGIRRDYVEGSNSSPVGYLEGIYILPKYRRQGIAQEMLRQAEAWALKRGCVEMGSDAYRTNRLSRKAHAGWGFAEAGEMVSFIKAIKKKEV